MIDLKKKTKKPFIGKINQVNFKFHKLFFKNTLVSLFNKLVFYTSKVESNRLLWMAVISQTFQ